MSSNRQVQSNTVLTNLFGSLPNRVHKKMLGRLAGWIFVTFFNEKTCVIVNFKGIGIVI